MRRLILLAGLAVWMIAFAVAADETIKKIEGTVMDADKKPLAGAEVTLYEYNTKESKADLVKTVKTGDDGKFGFESTIDPNDSTRRIYNLIQVAKPGLAWKTQYITGREDPKPLKVILGKPAAFAGQVVNKKREPVAGANVYPMAYKQGTSEDDTESVSINRGMDAFTTTTDGQGRFRFEQLPAEAKVGVTVDHPDYARFGNNPYQDGFEAGSQDVKIELAPAGSISGRVLDENSKPVAGVRVSCYARNSGGGMVPVVSDADGRYTIDRLSPASYTLASQSMSEEGAPKGLMMQRSGVELAEGQKLEGIDLKWMAGTVLRGRVVDSATSQPIQKANVHAYKMNRTNSDVGWSFTAATDKQGAFELRVGEGQISVQAYAQKYLPDDNRGQRQLEIKQGQTPEEVTLYLKSNPPIMVSGVVLDADGKPVAGAKVTTSNQSQSEKTDKNGKFTMKVIRQQSGPSQVEQMTLMANTKDMAGSAEIPENAGPKLDVTIKMRKAGSIAGQVVEPGGKPLAGATVQLLTRINMGRGYSLRQIGEARKTGADGKFEIGGLSDEELYGIRVNAKGHGSMSDSDIKGEAGKTIDKGKIELPLANAFVELTVLDDSGQPVQSANVYAYGQKQPEMMNTERTTNKEGKLKLGPLCAGEMNISLNKEGFSYANTQLALTTGTQQVEMEMIREAGSSERLKAGNAAPKLEGVTWCKDAVDLDGLKGRPVALVFFAPGNRPSQRALDKLASFSKEFGDKLTIAAVCDASVKEDALKELVASKGYAFPVGQVDGDKKFGWASPAFRAYEVRAVPSIVLIGPDGKIKQNEVPIGKMEQSVREMMKN